MTSIYFVRHAQPVHSWKEDRTRPLTPEGEKDCEQVCQKLLRTTLQYAVSSPYQRSVDTIKKTAESHGLQIHFDKRFRERQNGSHFANSREMIKKRWADFDYHEEGGESLAMVQKRNIEGLFELLREHSDEAILFGTHGTALSSILNYFDPSFGCSSFFRIIDYMPYIIRLDFVGTEKVAEEELLIIQKEFTER